jgi:hypothetical protein
MRHAAHPTLMCGATPWIIPCDLAGGVSGCDAARRWRWRSSSQRLEKLARRAGGSRHDGSKAHCLWVVCGLLSTSAVHAQSNCNDFNRLVHDAAENFEQDKGAYLTDSDRWVSGFRLPNAKSCVIEPVSGSKHASFFKCRWQAPSDADAKATGNAIIAQLRQCMTSALGSRPGQRDFDLDADAIFDLELFYEPPGKGATFRVTGWSTSGKLPAGIELDVTPSFHKVFDEPDFDLGKPSR